MPVGRPSSRRVGEGFNENLFQEPTAEASLGLGRNNAVSKGNSCFDKQLIDWFPFAGVEAGLVGVVLVQMQTLEPADNQRASIETNMPQTNALVLHDACKIHVSLPGSDSCTLPC